VVRRVFLEKKRDLMVIVAWIASRSGLTRERERHSHDIYFFIIFIMVVVPGCFLFNCMVSFCILFTDTCCLGSCEPI
jgi:hypothetical protein